MAHLISVTPEPDREVDASRVILLLGFRKAYDTVSREFLFEVLQFFGFAEPFITLIRRLHDGTTARFSVNGVLSDPTPVVTGIRQGCPLAPLLFLLVAEIVDIAIVQNSRISGLRHPKFLD